jgi:hypothetical protein
MFSRIGLLDISWEYNDGSFRSDGIFKIFEKGLVFDYF